MITKIMNVPLADMELFKFLNRKIRGRIIVLLNLLRSVESIGRWLRRRNWGLVGKWNNLSHMAQHGCNQFI